MIKINHIKTACNYLFSTPIGKSLTTPSVAEAAGSLALISTLTKDAVNCYYYTSQSLHNKKIPEEKRKFVAGMDFSNGVLNVIVPMLFGHSVNRSSGKWFNKLLGHLFNEKAADKWANLLKSTSGKTFVPKDILSVLGKSKTVASAAFQALTVLLFSQVFCKRVITPFFATPIAGFLKKQGDKMEANQKDTDSNSESDFPVENNGDKVILTGGKTIQPNSTNLIDKFVKEKAAS